MRLRGIGRTLGPTVQNQTAPYVLYVLQQLLLLLLLLMRLPPVTWLPRLGSFSGKGVAIFCGCLMSRR